MRLSNRKGIPVFNFIYSLVGIIFVLGVIAYILEINQFDVLGDKAWVLLLVPILMSIFLYFLGRPLFEYDSDGEALNFRNNHIFFIFSKKNSKDEFPKYKLLKFSIVNAFVFKRLYIYVSSKKNNIIVLKYDISYLSNKQVKDLKISLNKVEKANKENRKEDNTATD